MSRIDLAAVSSDSCTITKCASGASCYHQYNKTRLDPWARECDAEMATTCRNSASVTRSAISDASVSLSGSDALGSKRTAGLENLSAFDSCTLYRHSYDTSHLRPVPTYLYSIFVYMSFPTNTLGSQRRP